MNVLYCCDDQAYDGLAASIYSLLTYTKNVNIYVFTMDYKRPPDSAGLVQCFAELTKEHKGVRSSTILKANSKTIDEEELVKSLIEMGISEEFLAEKNIENLYIAKKI